MMAAMKYEDLVVLIPCHSLEDFPTELSEEAAEGLLNAFAILWHPALLAAAGVMPSWRRADDPPESVENRLVLVPSACEGWVPCDWVERMQGTGGVVINGLSDRQELLAAALDPLSCTPDADATEADESDTDQGAPDVHPDWDVDPDLAADFLALGTCYLQTELLTRQMHHYSSLDEVHIQRESVAAAQAALAGDKEAAESRLSACFESLMEARERFYPVECYLIDLCLLIPRLADEHFKRILEESQPANLLISAEDLQQIGEAHPDLLRQIREARQSGTIDVCGGELREGPLPLLPMESALSGFERGIAAYQQLLGEPPKTWGRRRYGLATQLPQILAKSGYHSAIHVALDDGIYPDAEQSKIRWEGCDGTVLDAVTRIPLAADSATSYLRFPARMAESMQEDQVAAVLFARWPEVKSPWFDDFQRMRKYSPVLGTFTTFDNFFEHTDTPGRLSRHEPHEYLTPFLYYAVGLQEPDPLSRYVDHVLRRHRFDAAVWCHALANLLLGKPIAADKAAEVECRLEDAGPDAPPEDRTSVENVVAEFEAASAKRLSEVIMHGAGEQPGCLVLNPLSFARRISVAVPGIEAPPAASGAVKTVQFDDARKVITLDVPASGYVWIPAVAAPPEPAPKGQTTPEMPPPTVSENVIRNEFFEVHINEATGGIARIKGHGRKPNRLSQQLAYRFPRERTFLSADDEDDEVTTEYSEMRCHSLEVTCDGPALGEVVTTGEIVDQQFDRRLAGFQQTVRVWRGRPVVEVDIEIDTDEFPDSDPWRNYYAARFAWNDSTATVTRSMLEGAHDCGSDRFESLHYVEISDDKERTTIVHHGLPFHRITGPRMLDTLLAVSGETRRRFRFTVAVDVAYPMQAALDAMSPPVVIQTSGGPPQAGTSGWFFSLDAKNVQLTRITGPMGEPASSLEPWEAGETPQLPPADGFAVRLRETEGRFRQIKLGCWRSPTSARKRDFLGRTISVLEIEGDSVVVELDPHEIADVELHFEE